MKPMKIIINFKKTYSMNRKLGSNLISIAIILTIIPVAQNCYSQNKNKIYVYDDRNFKSAQEACNSWSESFPKYDNENPYSYKYSNPTVVPGDGSTYCGCRRVGSNSKGDKDTQEQLQLIQIEDAPPDQKEIKNENGKTENTPVQPAGTGQPKGITDILQKNAPSRNTQMQETLAKDIENYRIKTGIRRIDESATPRVPVKGGTVAVSRTDIRTLENKPFGGASRKAIPAKFKGKEGSTGGTELKPANPIAVDDAEQVSLANLSKAIDVGLKAKTITRKDLQGAQVWMRVEQEPCPSCASGLDNPKAAPGVIKQFSQKYPELKIEIRNSRTSRSYYIQNGVAVQ